MTTVKNIRPWGNFVIDESTGLPLLPSDDLFFRVAPIIKGYWVVELRRKRKWRTSIVEERYTADIRYDPVTKDNILGGSAHVLIKFLERPVNDTSYKSLFGDYPPKTLNVKED